MVALALRARSVARVRSFESFAAQRYVLDGAQQTQQLEREKERNATPLKVLVVVSCFPPSKGGVEKTSYELALGLARAGNEVTVVTSSRGKQPGSYVEKMGPLKVVRYPETSFLFDAPLVPKIAAAALTEDYDVLHVHGMTPSISDLAILFAKLRGKPVVLTYHNDAQESYPGPVARLAGAIYSRLAIPIVRMANVIVSSTRSYAETSPVLKHIMGAVVVVPWGTDTSRFTPRARSPAKDGRRHVLFVGQLKKYKGVDVLLDSVARLNRAGHAVVADIVGTGPYAGTLKARATALGLGDEAKFWGPVDDGFLPAFYAGCDLVALPSVDRREAFGLVMLEAFAAGKPVVATKIPGVSEAASRGRSYLAEPGDAESFARRILDALDGLDSAPSPAPSPEISNEHAVVKYESILRFASAGGRSWGLFLLTIFIWAALQATGSPDSQSTSAALTGLLN